MDRASDDVLGAAPRGDGWRGRRDADPLEQRLDRLVSAGRQFVDGVSGARPGSRSGGRSGAGRSRSALPSLRPADLGRWVEDRLDRLLEDDGDDWREPWQEEPPAMAPAPRRPLEAISRRGRGGPSAPQAPPLSPLTPTPAAPMSPAEPRSQVEPRSRTEPRSPAEPRSQAVARPPAADGLATPSGAAAGPDDWPDDDSFTVPRWQRPAALPRRPADSLAPPPSSPPPPARPLPRSTRRR